MPGDILSPVSLATLFPQAYKVRAASPKTIMREQSPIKKRRVDGYVEVDYGCRKGSRSGDLALLRALSAPVTPTPEGPLPAAQRQSSFRRPGLAPLNARPQSQADDNRSRICDPPQLRLSRLVQPAIPSSCPQASTSISSPTAMSSKMQRDLDARGPIQSGLSEAKRSSTNTASTTTTTIITTITTTPPKVPTSPTLSKAEALAGPIAAHCKVYIPPASIDAVSCFLDPEAADAPASQSTTTTPPSTTSAPMSPVSAVSPASPTSMASKTFPLVAPTPKPLKQRITSLLPRLSSSYPSSADYFGSTNSTTLLLVYPTRAGAQAFADKLLGPVLDPVLRRAVTDKGLLPAAAANIRNMDAVDGMPEYEELQEAVRGIVEVVNEKWSEMEEGKTAGQQNKEKASREEEEEKEEKGEEEEESKETEAEGMRSSTGKGELGSDNDDEKLLAATGPLEVQFAAKTTVQVPTATWKNAWIAQERGRIRRILRDGGLSDGGATLEIAGIKVARSAVRVAEELLEEMRVRDVEDEMQQEMEVGVFVLGRK